MATARLWAGESVASRVIFTDVASKSTHISRARCVDLFLDTPECNAHTTSADVAWSGTPVLTFGRRQYKMCSRMAGSIISSALPEGPDGDEARRELLATSEEEYEETAIRLARGLRYSTSPGITNGVSSATTTFSSSSSPSKLQKRSSPSSSAKHHHNHEAHHLDHPTSSTFAPTVRASGRLVDLHEMLWRHRWTSRLFDTRRWVRDLETGYEEAWRRWVRGEGGDIWL